VRIDCPPGVVSSSIGHGGAASPASSAAAETVRPRLDTLPLSADADWMNTTVGSDDGGVVGELAAVAEAKRELSRREEVAVRRGRHSGLSWAEIGTLLGVTKQTIHRKYRKTG
jgi:DNA-directed RNA polymerase specialized sigma24 family protein